MSCCSSNFLWTEGTVRSDFKNNIFFKNPVIPHFKIPLLSLNLNSRGRKRGQIKCMVSKQGIRGCVGNVWSLFTQLLGLELWKTSLCTHGHMLIEVILLKCLPNLKHICSRVLTQSCVCLHILFVCMRKRAREKDVSARLKFIQIATHM